MKILRFNDDRIGILKDGNTVVDVSDSITSRRAKGPQRVMEEIMEHFHRYRRKFERLRNREDGIPLAAVKLQAPLAQPRKCLAAFSNYLDRPDRSPESFPNEYFYKAPELLGPEGTVVLLDLPVVVYQAEAEIAFVIGKRAKDVPEEEAMEHVFGYVPFFDVSARGLTRRTQFVPKGQDTFGPCGPWITTKDEIPDPHNLAVKSWINGELKQNYNTRHMIHKIPEQIAWLSRFVQLQPGDLITTGTYHEGLAPINDGDVIEIEIQGMGKAKFFVKGHGPWKDAEWVPGISQPPAPPGGGLSRV